MLKRALRASLRWGLKREDIRCAFGGSWTEVVFSEVDGYSWLECGCCWVMSVVVCEVFFGHVDVYCRRKSGDDVVWDVSCAV